MGRNKNKKLTKEAYFGIIISIFSVFIIVLLFIIESQKKTPDIPTLVENSINGTLCSIVASVIFAVLQRAFTNSDEKQIVQQLQQIEKSLQRQNELYDSGIISIHPKTHFDEEEEYWKNIINGTNKRLDLIGHSISNWLKKEYKELFIAKIKQILESGNNVNIVLSAKDVDYSKVKEAFYDYHKRSRLSKIEKTILTLCEVIKDVAKDKQHNLKVYVTNPSRVTYLYIRTDGQCIISPYIYSVDNNNNSFLLELQPRTSYVKFLEDDFEEMTGNLRPIDLNLNEYQMNGHNMRIIDKIYKENKYSGSNWNFEKTEKYIFEDNGKKYEVGYFEHYKDTEFIKSVIELPVSYGCPSKCLFCASSNINVFCQLKEEQMRELFEYVYCMKEMDKFENVLLSVTGMGDLFFNEENVFKFLKSLKSYKNLSITLSSGFWSSELLRRTVNLNETLPIRFIQLTYIGDDIGTISKLVPIYNKLKLSSRLDEFTNFVSKIDAVFFRVNYIAIAGINDSEDSLNNFVEKFRGIKDKVIVRISKLNETNATKRNSLQAVPVEKLENIKSSLLASGFKCYVFYSYENDKMNCGQLVTELP